MRLQEQEGCLPQEDDEHLPLLQIQVKASIDALTTPLSLTLSADVVEK